jgi:hypothetical protein
MVNAWLPSVAFTLVLLLSAETGVIAALLWRFVLH